MRRRISQWFFYPESDQWISILRVGVAIQLIGLLISVRADWSQLLSSGGHAFVSRDLNEALLSLESQLIPRIGWLVDAAKRVGIGEQAALEWCWYFLALLSGLLLIGLFCRFTAVLTWFVYLAAVNSGGYLTYGVDALTTTGLFYLMLSPLPDRLSLDHRWWKKSPGDPCLLGFWRRVLQIHLCLIYFFSGVTKALGSGWWDGANLWRALTRPPFDIISPDILVHFKYVYPIAGIGIWLLEIGYPFFTWQRQLRRPWLIAILVMHVGIGLAMGMYLFASVMVVLNLAAFGPGIVFSVDSPSTEAKRVIVP